MTNYVSIKMIYRNSRIQGTRHYVSTLGSNNGEQPDLSKKNTK